MNTRSFSATTAAIIVAVVVLAGVAPQSATADSSDGATDVSLDAGAHTVTDESSDVRIRLPGETSTSGVDVDALPSSSFAGTDDPLLSTSFGGSVISSFTTHGGVQTLIEIPNSGAPREYRFALTVPAGGTTEVTADGGVVVKAADGIPVGGFKAPWALDAQGQAVRTSFRIEGSDLIQVVEFTPETAFPIIADPDWGTEWWGRWLRLTKKETKALAAASGDIQSWIGVLSGACAAVPPLATACAAIINISALIHGQIVRDAAKKGLCVAINAPYTSAPPPHMTVVKCTR